MQDNVLFLSEKDYDFGSINKIIQVNSDLGEVHIHDAEGGYLLTFTGCPEGTEKAMADFKRYLTDLTNNRWSH